MLMYVCMHVFIYTSEFAYVLMYVCMRVFIYTSEFVYVCMHDCECDVSRFEKVNKDIQY